jgi:undecaprenyl pyrophosphate phosphatase UppP
MAHGGKAYPKDLPATWPFRVAGTIFIAAFSWFCLGFAIKDTGEELANHLPVFWLLVVAGIVFVVGGAVFNINRELRRRRSLG